MSIVPTFTSTCDLANRLPALVAAFLDVETGVRRRFREESVSDVIVASMLSLPGNDIAVITPDETKTGSDFDILLIDLSSRAKAQFRIQAKRLKPHGTNWQLGSYHELAHPAGTGKQAQTIVRSSVQETIPTIPLYAFYNPAAVCAASGGKISGIELADAHAINTLVQRLVKSKPKRPPLKRLQTLQPLFFPLTTILCSSPDTSSGGVPRPIDTIAKVRRTITDRGSAIESIQGFDFGSSHRGSAEMAASDGPLPPIIEQAIRFRGSVRQFAAKVSRPKIILFSE